LALKYRTVGDLRLSEIAFGCGGNAGLMVRGSFDEQTRMAARALDLGVNYFDNSPDYGNCVAEENLGRVLKALKARPLINSKVEIRAEDLGDVAGHVVRSAEASLKRLGVDCFDVLQIHNGPIDPAPAMEGKFYAQLWIEHYLRPGGAIEGLRRLKDAGKARHVGFICRGNDGAYVRQLLDTGLFSIINTPYTLLNPTAGRPKPAGFSGKDYGDVLSAARARGVGGAIYSPLAGGFLTDDTVDGRDRHALARKPKAEDAATQRNNAAAAQLRFLARENGITLAQAAIRFVLMHPGVTTALGGFSAIEQLEEIAKVPDLPAFTADQMARVEKLWATNFAE
jgi:L-glyceraldehyde 3-phosphate reductase